MTFKYSTTHPSQTELDSLPRIPILLQSDNNSMEVVGLVDSGATINVLPFEVGLALGKVWDNQKATIQLAGNLSNMLAQAIVVDAILGDYPAVPLAFAWVQRNDIPVILGQTNFFAEFDISFFRSRFEFEVKPKGQ